MREHAAAKLGTGIADSRHGRNRRHVPMPARIHGTSGALDNVLFFQKTKDLLCCPECLSWIILAPVQKAHSTGIGRTACDFGQ